MFHALFWNDDMEKIRINKYISDAGFCSRREADQLIVDERVTINGVLAAMGAKVSLEDKVRIDGEIGQGNTVKRIGPVSFLHEV